MTRVPCTIPIATMKKKLIIIDLRYIKDLLDMLFLQNKHQFICN
jgi:hypothetical protein